MATLTIRNVPDEVHRALRARAAAHGRSAEAEVRDILSTTLMSAQRIRLGDFLAAVGREAGLTDEDIDAFNSIRDRTPAEPLELL